MDFLVYVEHNAENLQFYLWYRDYIERWAQLPDRDQALAPVWTAQKAQAARNRGPTEKSNVEMNDLEAANTVPRIPSNKKQESTTLSTDDRSEDASSLRNSVVHHGKKSAAAFEAVGAYQPFTIQPFREEISRVIAVYIADDSVRNLNLSHKERTALLRALSTTTHPSALLDVATTVKFVLRHQLYPNFIRWTIRNGNAPRQTFVQGLGIAGIVAGIVSGVIMVLNSADRGWRAFIFLACPIGTATLYAGWKGMCIVLHGMHHRHVRPWELFGDGSSSDYELKRVHSSRLARRTATKTNRGSPSMTRETSSERSSTAKCGFKNRPCDPSRTPSFSKLV